MRSDAAAALLRLRNLGRRAGLINCISPPPAAPMEGDKKRRATPLKRARSSPGDPRKQSAAGATAVAVRGDEDGESSSPPGAQPQPRRVRLEPGALPTVVTARSLPSGGGGAADDGDSESESSSSCPDTVDMTGTSGDGGDGDVGGGGGGSGGSGGGGGGGSGGGSGGVVAAAVEGVVAVAVAPPRDAQRTPRWRASRPSRRLQSPPPLPGRPPGHRRLTAVRQGAGHSRRLNSRRWWRRTWGSR